MTASPVSPSVDWSGDPEREVIFSSRDGYVWASWPDTDATVKLGRHQMVATMMQDFLAQDSLGRRLARRPRTGK